MLSIVKYSRKISCERSTGLLGDVLSVPTQLAYPVDCRGLCRNRYRNNALKKLRKNYERFTITIIFAIVGSKQVTLTFCGIFDTGKWLQVPNINHE